MVGSRVEKVYQPDSATLQLKIFPPRDGYLTVSASSKHPYVALLADKLEQPPAPPRFCQLVRSRLEGGGIESIEQVGLDRAVRLVVRRREDDRDHRYELTAQLFGPHADITLYELDPEKPLGHLRNGPMPPRPTSPERPVAFAVALEPFLERALAEDSTAVLFRELDAMPPGLAKIGLAMARERGVPAAALALRTYLDAVGQHAYAPRVQSGEVLLASLEVPGTPTIYPSVLELVRVAMVEGVRENELEARRAGVTRALREMEKRESERLRHTRENLARCAEAETFERWGNLLKGQLAAIQPYRDSVEVVDWYDPAGAKVKIPLKKNLPPRQNVERYFLKAKKLRASVDQLEARLAEHEDNLAHVEGLQERLGEARDREALEEIESHVRAIGRVATGKPKQAGEGGPLEFVSSDGYRILVGRSSHENDHLSRKMAKPHDMWLHAKGLAGAHVVVRMKNRDEECPPGTLEEAAQLAAHYSKARYSSKVEVLVTRAGQVRKPQGLAPGQVLVDGARSIMVKADPQVPVRLARPI